MQAATTCTPEYVAFVHTTHLLLQCAACQKQMMWLQLMNLVFSLTVLFFSQPSPTIFFDYNSSYNDNLLCFLFKVSIETVTF